MPYALFENDERLTRPFRTEREVWEAAERADLIEFGTHGEKTLDNNFEIKPCDATPEELAVAEDGVILPDRRSEDSQFRNGAAGPRSPQATSKQTSS